MVLKKNILVGKNSFFLSLLISFFLFTSISHSKSQLEGSFTEIKILDKISSKNTSLKLKNGQLIKFKDLSIQSLKCKNSEFDDNPEITAYLQVKDNNIKNKDKVFTFNGWTFASSPTLNPFDHPIYDIWLKKCFN